MGNINQKTKKSMVIFLENFDSVLCKPELKFLSDAVYGILKTNTVHLTDISDVLSRDVNKLSNENRLSRNLKNFDFDKIKDIEINLYKKALPDEEATIIIDDSDITKPKSIALEHLSLVTDGSEGHNVVLGYYTNNLVALTKDKMPIFLHSEVYYPPTDKANNGFRTKANMDGIKDVEASLSDKKRLFLCDRGYDNQHYIKHFFNNGDFFIIRSSGNRDFYFSNNKHINLVYVVHLMTYLNVAIGLHGSLSL
jgi:glutamyl/glutaminyl-tRNA synthetase